MADDRGFDLLLRRDGAALHAAAAVPILSDLERVVRDHDGERAGVRIAHDPRLASSIGVDGPVGRIAADILGQGCRPVRAVLFDKRAETNWALGWHQDRTIVVRERRDVAGFGPWTVKQGLHHVAPPFALLAGMVTVRVHLDAVSADNAPLRIAPGSHRLGRVPVDRIAAAVRDHPERSCLARAGDVWIYATPILHASDRATRPARRRVVQVDYAACDLPGGLQWQGVGTA